MSGPAPAPLLGPQGPFPHAPLADPLERRWLHYAFFTRDGRLSLVANIAWLGGGPDSPPLTTAVLLVHEAGVGWSCSQWNAVSERMPWSSFRHGGPREDLLALRSRRGVPAVDLQLRRTATPCSSQCATFHDEHWMRWQSEPGVLADGTWSVDGRPPVHASAVGYHERVRGRWGWPEMGGWVFGFCNDVGGAEDRAPEWAVVFTLLQPSGRPEESAASVMLWRRGRLVQHFGRRALRVSVAGQLDRDRVSLQPTLARTLGTPPAAPIPAVLAIEGVQGADAIRLGFRADAAARLAIPSESSLRPFSVHEVVGAMELLVVHRGRRTTWSGPSVVEFAGGAAGGLGDGR
ncbi:hypothetical protein L6R50_13945 [Myxococcota bacterium]|nr:hypothetical protein [Myxococcota bacterium]